jgi:hypothetical protein
MTNIERAIIGALGGLSAVLVRYLSQDHAVIMQALDAGIPFTKTAKLVFDYSIVTPITVVLGGIIGWIVEESNKMKVFAMAVSAPALITTWAGASSSHKSADLQDLLQPARAFAQQIEDKRPNVSDAFATFSTDRDHTYAVHVGSFTVKDNADQLLARINTQSKTLRGFTGEYRDPQGQLFHRVFVIQLLTLRDALALREALLKSRAVTYAAPMEIGK